MSRFEVVTVDRRQAYYEASGAVLAADPLDFYARAERGRRWQYMTFQLPHEYERMAQMTAESVWPEYENGDC